MLNRMPTGHNARRHRHRLVFTASLRRPGKKQSGVVKKTSSLTGGSAHRPRLVSLNARWWRGLVSEFVACRYGITDGLALQREWRKKRSAKVPKKKLR